MPKLLPSLWVFGAASGKLARSTCSFLPSSKDHRQVWKTTRPRPQPSGQDRHRDCSSTVSGAAQQPFTQCQSNTQGTFTPPSTLGGGHHHLHDRDTGRDISKANFKMTARTSAPSSTIDVDVDSPGNKRPCPSPSNQESTPWTLEMFQSAIQPLITKVGNMETRVGQVEAAFTERMQEQVNLLTATTHTQSQHTADLIGLQQQDKVNQETFIDIKKRETTPAVLPPRANSSTTADERQPELIMGGWADDQDASVTLQLAKDAVATSNSTWTCREPLCRGLDVDTWWFHMRPGNMSPKATYTVASQQPSRK